MPVGLHTDGLNESGELADTIAAIGGAPCTRTTWRAPAAGTPTCSAILAFRIVRRLVDDADAAATGGDRGRAR